MGTIIMAPSPAALHQLKVSLIENNTSYNGADVTGNWVVFRQQAVSAAQAEYNKLTVVAHVETISTAGGGLTAQTYARVQVAGTQVGQLVTGGVATNGLGSQSYVGNCLIVTLVAGVDYTRGTGFNLDFAQRGVVSNPVGTTCTAYLLGYNIEGVSD